MPNAATQRREWNGCRYQPGTEAGHYESWFQRAQADCHFMHCLPVRRNVAVADEILDGPRSRVLREAANRMVVQMAVLHRLLKGN